MIRKREAVMRIIYDDSMQNRFVSELLPDFLSRFKRGSKELNEITEYDYGMNRVQSYRLKEKLNDYLSEYGFSIGNVAEHAHGIGNNCKSPVYYEANATELQICCYINLNKGLYNEVFISCEDYNKKKLGFGYEIRPYGITTMS